MINNNSANRLRYFGVGLSAIGLTLSLSCGFSSCNELARVEERLRQNGDYVESLRLEELKSELDSSVYKLTYRSSYTTRSKVGKHWATHHHSARYPDPSDAKQILYSVADKLGDVESIEDNLREIAKELPEENNMRAVNNENVNNQTFQNQRAAIESEQNNLGLLINQHMSQVPRSLKEQKSENQNNILFSVLGGIASLILGIYCLTKRDY